MPSYRFQYFDVRGRGELCRYVFAAAGKEFEDARVPRDGWPAIKPTTPFGQMPVLEVDGKKVAQSQSIARFLAREFGLAGKDSWEQALVDQYMGLVDDMFKEIVKVFFEKDETKKAELQKNLLGEVFPKFLGLFEKGLEKNGGKYFVGNSMTLADLAILDGFDTPVQNNSSLMDKFPKMKAHRAAIAGTANLSAYIQNRKRSDI